MTLEEILNYFGDKAAVAKALGTSKPVVYEWFNKNRIPYGRQCEIERFTEGVLKADKRYYPLDAEENKSIDNLLEIINVKLDFIIKELERIS